MKISRTVAACQYCGIYYHVPIDTHEITCPQNPAAPKRIRSGNRQYVLKKPAVMLGETPLSISVLFFQWDTETRIALLKDDAFHLLRKELVVRTKHSNIFMVVETIGEDDLDMVWELIEKARKLGARL